MAKVGTCIQANQESREYVDELTDFVLDFLRDRNKNEKWIYARELEEAFTCLVESISYELEHEN